MDLSDFFFIFMWAVESNSWVQGSREWLHCILKRRWEPLLTDLLGAFRSLWTLLIIIAGVMIWHGWFCGIWNTACPGSVPGAFPGSVSGKEIACQCRRLKGYSFNPGLGRFPGGRHGNPFQYSCLENPMDRGAWRATVHGVEKSWTRLKWLSTTQHNVCPNENRETGKERWARIFLLTLM